ncbi:MAG TPA: fatty acid desaturase family protein [Pirellulales bacterium]|nr:fatty acid desaturase family protein [Pirellulales bacterium]
MNSVAHIADQPGLEEPRSTHADQELDVPLGRFARATMMPEVRRLSRVSNLRSALTIALQWVMILSAGTLAVWSGHWLVYLLAMAVIGSRQQALGILSHDATHYLLFSNRKVNDLVSDLCCAFPVNMSTTLYRHSHFQHHRFVNTERDPDWLLQQRDPDWRWPKTRREALVLFFRCAFALNAHSAYRAAAMWSPAAHLFDKLGPALPLHSRLLYVLSSAAIWIVLIKTGILVPVLLLWLLPAMTMLNVTNRMRATGEHILTPSTHELDATRTVVPSPLERFFVAPLNVNYHLEHHLFPSVPACNLRQLHGVLMQDPQFRAQAHLTYSYFGKRGLIAELVEPQSGAQGERHAAPAG